MPKGKRKAQLIHAGRRFKERYGIYYKQHIEDHLKCAVHSNGAELVERQSNRVAVYDALYRVKKGDTDDPQQVGRVIIIRFVYDRNRKSVATVLPREDGEGYEIECSVEEGQSP